MLSTRHLIQTLTTVIIANILSLYEFSLFLSFSTLIGELFFPKDASPIVPLIQVFMVFAIGFLTRPLGTFFFSHIGDKIGRKTAIVCSVAMMVIPTLGIGVIPSYATIGIAAPILLAIMRMVQGFASGGEFSGTMAYLYEIAPVKYRGFTGSLTFASAQIGSVICTLEYLLVHHYVAHETILNWGWRVSFLLGGFIGLLTWFLRNTFHESPIFSTIKSEGKNAKKPILESFREHKKEMLQAFGITAISGAGWSILFVFSPIYFTKIVGLNGNTQLLFHAALLFYSSLIMPLFGYLMDRNYKRPLFFISSFGIILLSLPFYMAALYLPFPYFIAMGFLMVTFLSVQFALLPTLLCELFPLRVRFSCVGISYNLSILLLGGAAPLAILSLTSGKNHLLTPAFMLMGATIISLWTFKKSRKLQSTSTDGFLENR